MHTDKDVYSHVKTMYRSTQESVSSAWQVSGFCVLKIAN